MDRKEIKFKVGDIVHIDDDDYVGKALVVGYRGFGYDGEPNIAIFRPMVPFSNPGSHATYFSQKKLSPIRHVDIPEMDVLAVDDTNKEVADAVDTPTKAF